MIDWDGLVLAPLASTFGEPATYTPAGGSPFPIIGVFDEAYHELDLAGGMPVTTAEPVLGVRTAQFASPPQQGDTLTIAPHHRDLRGQGSAPRRPWAGPAQAQPGALTMADATMLARRQVRLAALAALQAGLPADVLIDSPGDWATPPEKLPAVLLRVGSEHKQSIMRGPPEFTTTIMVEIEARLSAATATAAQDAIEALGYAIEQVLFTNQALIGIIQQYATVDTQVEITAEGKTHFGAFKMLLGVELPEMFDPSVSVVFPSLQTIGIDLDLQNVFDAAGTYPDPPFPDSVTPAPRTTGPDGRNEGALVIAIPT